MFLYFFLLISFVKTNLKKQISSDVLKMNAVIIMKLLVPFIPHLARECLELLKCTSPNKWPEVDTKNIKTNVKFAIQINGKTRDIITISKDINEDGVNKIVLNNSKAKKYLVDKNVIKTIFVKNKIINYIVKS